MLWRLCRPSDAAEHPGLGMSWDDAISLGPVQARFLLLDHKQILEMERLCRLNRLESQGHSREDVKAQLTIDVKKYYADLREKFTGTREAMPRVTPKYRQRNQEQRRAGKRSPRSRRR